MSISCVDSDSLKVTYHGEVFYLRYKTNNKIGGLNVGKELTPNDTLGVSCFYTKLTIKELRGFLLYNFYVKMYVSFLLLSSAHFCESRNPKLRSYFGTSPFRCYRMVLRTVVFMKHSQATYL